MEASRKPITKPNYPDMEPDKSSSTVVWPLIERGNHVAATCVQRLQKNIWINKIYYFTDKKSIALVDQSRKLSMNHPPMTALRFGRTLHRRRSDWLPLFRQQLRITTRKIFTKPLGNMSVIYIMLQRTIAPCKFCISKCQVSRIGDRSSNILIL